MANEEQSRAYASYMGGTRSGDNATAATQPTQQAQAQTQLSNGFAGANTMGLMGMGGAVGNNPWALQV